MLHKSKKGSISHFRGKCDVSYDHLEGGNSGKRFEA
jgi:hypothetical protein